MYLMQVWPSFNHHMLKVSLSLSLVDQQKWTKWRWWRDKWKAFNLLPKELSLVLLPEKKCTCSCTKCNSSISPRLLPLFLVFWSHYVCTCLDWSRCVVGKTSLESGWLKAGGIWASIQAIENNWIKAPVFAALIRTQRAAGWATRNILPPPHSFSVATLSCIIYPSGKSHRHAAVFDILKLLNYGWKVMHASYESLLPALLLFLSFPDQLSAAFGRSGPAGPALAASTHYGLGFFTSSWGNKEVEADHFLRGCQPPRVYARRQQEFESVSCRWLTQAVAVDHALICQFPNFHLSTTEQRKKLKLTYIHCSHTSARQPHFKHSRPIFSLLDNENSCPNFGLVFGSPRFTPLSFSSALPFLLDHEDVWVKDEPVWQCWTSWTMAFSDKE